MVAEVGGRNRSETLEAPFVGRDDELRLLKDLFHATARENRARLVSVIGPAGIGKSRLAWEFLKYTDGLVDTVWWHQGRSPSYGDGITFWALGEMVRGRCGLRESDDERTTRAKVAETLATHVPDAGERGWIEPALLALLGIEAGIGSEQLFGAWRTFFERLAVSAPVVMVLEDFHFADAGLLDFVDHLMEWSKNVPIYVVTLSRPELLEKRPTWGACKRNFVSLYLEPLPEPAMRELLLGLVPGLPESAVRSIISRADGIPLYAVETVRMLIAEGRLALEDGAYHPVGDLRTLAVPETLSALIASRLDSLGNQDRALVSDAAVLGQSFTLAGLAAVSGIPDKELEPRLRALVQRELLTLEADPRSPERGQYGFVQALIREVAYNTLSHSDRKIRHLAAARFFEVLGSDELAGALAGHYLAAQANAPEGAEADALAGQARIALRAAAGRAAALGAHDQALAFLSQALTVTTDPVERADLLEPAGSEASAAGRHDQAEALLRSALDLRRATGDRAAIARATAALASELTGIFRADAALQILEPAVLEFADLVGQPRNWKRLQPNLSRPGQQGQENSIAAEDHVLNSRNLGDLEAHGGLKCSHMARMHPKCLAGCQLLDDQLAAELQPGCSLAAHLLQHEPCAAKDACAQRLLEAYADCDLRGGAQKPVPVNHVLRALPQLHWNNVSRYLGGEGDLAAGLNGAVFGHEEAAAAGHPLERTENSAASAHLCMGCHLNGSGHPRELTALRKNAFVGVKLHFEHGHSRAENTCLHSRILLIANSVPAQWRQCCENGGLLARSYRSSWP